MAQTPTASLDETFDALTHSHRRYVLYYLRTHSGAATIDTLSAMLANELEGPSATPGTDTTEHIEVDLHHTHLPKLVDAGLITFARDRQSIGRVAKWSRLCRWSTSIERSQLIAVLVERWNSSSRNAW